MFGKVFVALFQEDEVLNNLLVEGSSLLDVFEKLGFDPEENVVVIVIVYSVLLLINSQSLEVVSFSLVYSLIEH